jgi:hypothetical protein
MKSILHLLFILGVALLTSCASHHPTHSGTATNPVFGETAEIFVVGAVKTPGRLVTARDANFHEVLVAAGGFTDEAVRDRLTIVRWMELSAMREMGLPDEAVVESPGAGGRRSVGFNVNPSKPQNAPLPWRTGDALIVSTLPVEQPQ